MLIGGHVMKNISVANLQNHEILKIYLKLRDLYWTILTALHTQLYNNNNNNNNNNNYYYDNNNNNNQRPIGHVAHLSNAEMLRL